MIYYLKRETGTPLRRKFWYFWNSCFKPNKNVKPHPIRNVYQPRLRQRE